MSRQPTLRSVWCWDRLARLALLTLCLQAAPGLVGHAGQAQAQQTPAPRVERSLDHARRLLRAGRAEEASRVLETLLEEHPGSPDALVLLFEATAVRGEPEAFLPFIAEAAGGIGERGPAILELRVRSHLRVGRAEEARAFAERWVDAEPTEARAYAVLGAVHRETGHPKRAIATLERGRRQVGDRTLFRDELATLYAEIGRYGALAGEWLARLVERPSELGGVHRELTRLTSPDEAIELLASAAAEVTQPDAQRGVAVLALRLGDTQTARHLMSLALPALPPDRASVALASYMREAEEAGLLDEAAWGALKLTEVAASPTERWRWLALAAEKTLETGDTTSAVTSAERLVAQAPPRSDAAAAARERLIRLQASRPTGIDAARGLLSEYASLHPDSSMKIANLTQVVALGQVRSGQRAAALALLEAAPVGDGAARQVVEAARAVLELQQGNRAEARELLRRAVDGEGAPPELRTRWISLLVVLEEAEPLEAAWLGRALAAFASAPAATDVDPVELLTEWSGSPPAEGRAPALAYLATELDAAGRTSAAVAVHEILGRRLPDSPEAAGAMLALARHTLGTEPARSREWLERLVTRFPDSAVAPLARRMLAELSGRAPAATRRN